MRKSEKSRSGWYFLFVVFFVYLVFMMIIPGSVMSALDFVKNILTTILPLLLLVYLLLFLTDYFLKPKSVVKYLGKGVGFSGWFYSVVGGILSTGPIYMWYPLMSELKDKGMRTGFVACFLHNRAIKPALLPVFIHYFGMVFVVVLTVTTIVFSVLQGLIVERFVEVKK